MHAGPFSQTCQQTKMSFGMIMICVNLMNSMFSRSTVQRRLFCVFEVNMDH